MSALTKRLKNWKATLFSQYLRLILKNYSCSYIFDYDECVQFGEEKSCL